MKCRIPLYHRHRFQAHFGILILERPLLSALILYLAIQESDEVSRPMRRPS